MQEAIAKLYDELMAVIAGYPERYLPGEIQRAFELAKKAHANQTRQSGEPYLSHPLRAAVTVAKLQIDTPAVEAALLHDVIEDTPLGIEELKQRFGEEVAFLVDGVTKLGRFRYRGVESEVENMRKMLLATAQDIRVIIVKLADRLDNMRTLDSLEPDKQKRIALETLDIYAPIAYRLGIGDLAGDLEDLAFPYIYPKEHRWLMENVSARYEERQKILESMMPLVKEELSRAGIEPLEIHSRAKHYYSLYKKLLRYDMNLAKIYDLVAMRIIVADIAECYRALGAIHAAWKPLPGHIKDYIALPKPNGYRSLHTTVFGPQGEILEIQIRTPEMHQEAERGIAAHWAYSEQKGGKAYLERTAIIAPRKELAWVAQLSNWQKEFKGSREFMESLKIDFFKDRIFVLTPKGEAIDLPDGATPVDFAYHIHSDIGNQCSGARVNGKIVPLDIRLKSGDVVEILTQKNKKPSEQWLEFVKTSFAKNKIRDALKKKGGILRETPRTREAEFAVSARDRVGLLRDIASAFSGLGINMREIMSKDNAQFPIIAIKCALPAEIEPAKLVLKLKKIKNVESVSYKLK